VCVQNVRHFPQTKLDGAINAPFLLNKHDEAGRSLKVEHEF